MLSSIREVSSIIIIGDGDCLLLGGLFACLPPMKYKIFIQSNTMAKGESSNFINGLTVK